jgi:hypothetical protein
VTKFALCPEDAKAVRVGDPARFYLRSQFGEIERRVKVTIFGPISQVEGLTVRLSERGGGGGRMTGEFKPLKVGKTFSPDGLKLYGRGKDWLQCGGKPLLIKQIVCKKHIYVETRH